MRRREFISLLGSAATAWPFSARAQQALKVPRIGVLWHAGNEEEEEVYLSALRRGFSDLGYVEGRNIALLIRSPARSTNASTTTRSNLSAKRSML